MKDSKKISLAALAFAAFLAGGASAAEKAAEKAAGPSGKEAVETRRSAYNLIGKSFKPIGGILKGEVQYDAVDVEKLVERIVFLTDFIDGTFPDDSKLGEPATKAKPELWANKADFEKRLKEFKANALALQAVVEKDQSASQAFKDAAGKVAQDCKGCHDNYKLK